MEIIKPPRAFLTDDERLADVINDVPTVIWDIIYRHKEQAENKDRLLRYGIQLKYYTKPLIFLGSGKGYEFETEEKCPTFTDAQKEELEIDKQVRHLKFLKVAELKDECKKNGLQLSGAKHELMIKILAFRMYGMKLKMQIPYNLLMI